MIHPLLIKVKGIKQKKGKVVHCDYCGKEKYIMPCQINRNPKGNQKNYCSNDCRIKGQRTNDPLKCIVCGKEFYVSISQERDRNRKTCSKECKYKYIKQTGIMSGANCHFWKGGISGENRLIRYSPEMEKWRKSVFERDDYTCQECGVRGTDLEAHHIKPFADFKELRFDINNGETLCKACHEKTKLYNRKVNEEQIIQIRQDSRGVVAIAKDHGISKSQAWNIKNLKSWKDIECPSRPPKLTVE